MELDENGKVKYHFVIIDYLVHLKGGKLNAASDAAELRRVRLEDVENYALTETFREFFIKNYEEIKNFDSCKGHLNRKN